MVNGPRNEPNEPKGKIMGSDQKWDVLELLALLGQKPLSMEFSTRGTIENGVTKHDILGALAGLPTGAVTWAYLYAGVTTRTAPALATLTLGVRDRMVKDRVQCRGARTLDDIARGVAIAALAASIAGRKGCRWCKGTGKVLEGCNRVLCANCGGLGFKTWSVQDRCDASGLGISRQAYERWLEYEAVAEQQIAEWQDDIRTALRGLLTL